MKKYLKLNKSHFLTPHFHVTSRSTPTKKVSSENFEDFGNLMEQKLFFSNIASETWEAKKQLLSVLVVRVWADQAGGLKTLMY